MLCRTTVLIGALCACAAGADMPLTGAKELEAKLTGIKRGEGVLIGFGSLDGFEQLSIVINGADDYFKSAAAKAKVDVVVSEADEVADLLTSRGIEVGPHFGLAMFTHSASEYMGADYFEDRAVTPELVYQWAEARALYRNVDVPRVETMDDSQFSMAVYMPSRISVVLFDTDEVSKYAHVLSTAAEHFADRVEKKEISFVRATPTLTPERYTSEMKGLEWPILKFYGVRKGKYSPSVLKLSEATTTVAVQTWIESLAKPSDVARLRDQILPSLSPDNIVELARSTQKGVFAMFHAPWCGHCKRLMPVFRKLAGDLHKERDIAVAVVDGTKHQSLARKYKATAYPTLVWLDPKNAQLTATYEGERTEDALRRWAYLQMGRAVPGEESTQSLLLTEANFDSEVVESGRSVFVQFFAPWCGHCKKMGPAWESLAAHYEGRKDVTIAKLDGSRYGSIMKDYATSGFPSLLFFPAKDAAHPVVYGQSRTLEAMRSFVDARLKLEPEASKGAAAAAVATGGALGTAGKVFEFSDKTFQSFKDAAMSGKATQAALVMFYAPWCGHCKKIAPDYVALAAQLSNKFDKYVIPIPSPPPHRSPQRAGS